MFTVKCVGQNAIEHARQCFLQLDLAMAAKLFGLVSLELVGVYAEIASRGCLILVGASFALCSSELFCSC